MNKKWELVKGLKLKENNLPNELVELILEEIKINDLINYEYKNLKKINIKFNKNNKIINI